MKTQTSFKPKVLALAVGLAVIGGGYSLTCDLMDDGMSGFVSVAQAADNPGKGKQGANKGGKGKGGPGYRAGRASIRDILSEDEGEDSDRPPWAGVPGNEGKPGGGNAGGDTKKGVDYGDIWVILRDDNGVPILDANGNIQPCLDPGCTQYVQLTADGELPPEYADDVIAVEFGRLNIARSPSKVLDHALTEVLSKLDGGVWGDTVTLDPSGRLVVNGSTIDSPLENLALYEALLTTPAVEGDVTLSVTVPQEGGGTVTYSFTVPETVRLDLAASAIAAAADKTGDLNVDEIVNISGFMDSADELAALVGSYTYDRNVTYAGVQVWILVETSPGVFQPQLVNILDVVQFNDLPTIDGDADGVDRFAQAADDALQVLEYIHDNALDQ